MILSEKDQGRVLEHLTKARNILRTAKKGDEHMAKHRRQIVIEEINAVFHNVQTLNTRPL